MVTENSRVIIVDLLANSPSLRSASVHRDVSTDCCPRTGHYSNKTQGQWNAVRTVKPARKCASVTTDIF